MTAKVRNSLCLAAPWAVASAALIFLCLYDTGIIKLDLRRAPNLRKVSFERTVEMPDDIVIGDELILVNRDHPLPEDYEPDIIFYRDTDVYMNSAIVEDYGRLSDFIRENMGNRLYVSSTYRSYDDQLRVYNEEGPEVAAVPGCSEHQTGLALDVYVMYFAGSAFPESPVGRYVNEHCGEYGFIIRYPDGAEDITGFEYEPWHIRYVGQPHAAIISECHLTLEEYLDCFEEGQWYSCDDYYMARLPEDELLLPEELTGYPVRISRDNTGCLFITVGPV